MKKMGRPVELQGWYGELANAVGGTRELGRLMGLGPRMIQLYAAGKIDPKLGHKLVLASLAHQNHIPCPYEYLRREMVK